MTNVYNWCIIYKVIFMRLKKIKNSDEIIYNSKYLVKDCKKLKGKWKELFNNDNPIELEIGIGKGGFIISKAINNPNINYIGLEKYSSVLVSAVKKLENIEINNLKIINIDAFEIDEIFDKEISTIYLNFSDPWPKKRHAKRRLTHENFLKLYDYIFKNDINIEMKTDNDDLFMYSIESFKNHGYEIRKINRDIDDIYKTEYEIKFKSIGKNINYVSIYSKGKNDK